MSGHLAQRLAPILLGYAAACLAAGLVWVAAYGAVAAIAGSGAVRNATPFAASDILLALPLILVVAIWGAMFAVLPSALAIVIAEWRHIRSASVYAVAGVAIGVAAYLLYLAASAGFDPRVLRGALDLLARPATGLAAAAQFGGAGLVGGLVYHRIAGRNAGG